MADPADDIRAGTKRLLDHSAVGLVQRAADVGGKILAAGRQMLGRTPAKPRKPTGTRQVTGRRR